MDYQRIAGQLVAILGYTVKEIYRTIVHIFFRICRPLHSARTMFERRFQRLRASIKPRKWKLNLLFLVIEGEFSSSEQRPTEEVQEKGAIVAHLEMNLDRIAEHEMENKIEKKGEFGPQ